MSAAPVQLQRHPVAPCPFVASLTVAVTRTGDALSVIYQLQGDLSKLSLPVDGGGQRRDELWTATCFEAFFRAPDSDAYIEYNFAPNGDWAAYQFDGYRANMAHFDCAAPVIKLETGDAAATLRVTLPGGAPIRTAGPILFGPTAILEDSDGTRSFWAIHHALNKPDFHHIDTFRMTLD